MAVCAVGEVRVRSIQDRPEWSVREVGQDLRFPQKRPGTRTVQRRGDSVPNRGVWHDNQHSSLSNPKRECGHDPCLPAANRNLQDRGGIRSREMLADVAVRLLLGITQLLVAIDLRDGRREEPMWLLELRVRVVKAQRLQLRALVVAVSILWMTNRHELARCLPTSQSARAHVQVCCRILYHDEIICVRVVHARKYSQPCATLSRAIACLVSAARVLTCGYREQECSWNQKPRFAARLLRVLSVPSWQPVGESNPCRQDENLVS